MSQRGCSKVCKMLGSASFGRYSFMNSSRCTAGDRRGLTKAGEMAACFEVKLTCGGARAGRSVGDRWCISSCEDPSWNWQSLMPSTRPLLAVALQRNGFLSIGDACSRDGSVYDLTAHSGRTILETQTSAFTKREELALHSHAHNPCDMVSAALIIFYPCTSILHGQTLTQAFCFHLYADF